MFQQTKSMQLVSQGDFAQHKLGGIRAIEAVDTIDTHDAMLQKDRVVGWVCDATERLGQRSRMKVLRSFKRLFGQLFEELDDVFVPALAGPAHVPRNVADTMVFAIVVRGEKAIQVLDALSKGAQQLGLARLALFALDKVEHNDGCAVRTEQLAKVAHGRCVVGIDDGNFNRRAWRHVVRVLRPEHWNRAAHHDVRRKVRRCTQCRCIKAGGRPVERRCHGLADNLLRLDVVGDVAIDIDAALVKARTSKMPRAPRYERYIDRGAQDIELGLIHKAMHEGYNPVAPRVVRRRVAAIAKGWLQQLIVP